MRAKITISRIKIGLKVIECSDPALEAALAKLLENQTEQFEAVIAAALGRAIERSVPGITIMGTSVESL